ncbi:DUF4124 domain-containing protein [Undibacterium sp. Ji49W]|uniref:DUF4124 domain-containing protein n=1 Tax=Undibacterium sp. Ji49W TaxID=3413040 RepID=UPI003BF386AD
MFSVRLLLIFALFLPLIGNAHITACVDTDGKKTYTDGECPGTTVARIVRDPAQPPQIKPLSPAPAPVSVPGPHQNSIYVSKIQHLLQPF